ncbi:hypothetical protein [Acidovorax sp. CCYZU-2555]|uniref:hypothetical protein n=1 Tax=Acidovorax sp. CCYZU-2555 TaxID=2835042 RepID=UPI001BCCA47A|nr:hypothetical protein [Acidovorax sp. CCYZU-2555]MBS7777663.1 hypothetical protein [Acidovorax sp. CCYZU-2555]
MNQWETDEMNRAMEQSRKQMARMSPIRFSVKKIQSMSDAEIMGIMSGEVKLEGTLYHDTLHLLSTELNRREVQRASLPHWTTTPGFVLTAIAAIASVVAAVASVVPLLRAPEPAPQSGLSATARTEPKPDSAQPQAPK